MINKEFFAEALAPFYSCNTFRISNIENAVDLLSMTANAEHIRHIDIDYATPTSLELACCLLTTMTCLSTITLRLRYIRIADATIDLAKKKILPSQLSEDDHFKCLVSLRLHGSAISIRPSLMHLTATPRQQRLLSEKTLDIERGINGTWTWGDSAGSAATGLESLDKEKIDIMLQAVEEEDCAFFGLGGI